MRSFYLVMLSVCLISSAKIPAVAQGLPEAQEAFYALQAENTSDRAADTLRTAALQDSDAREFLAERLPGLIEKPFGKVWGNSVRLAGDLKDD
jgi:hypothetical protein